VRHEHLVLAGETGRVGETVDDARRDAECAAERGDEQRMLGAVALWVARDL
jgi:hypothetical protein